jgi:DNA-binding MarR family transcriptional regulator
MASTAVLTWLRLARVYQKVDRAAIAHLRTWGLSLAQFDVLVQVGAHEGVTQQELAEALLVTKGNVCQLLDRLEAAGLIIRRQEGRTNRLFLTPRGRELAAEVIPAHEGVITHLFESLSTGEQRQALALLRKLDRALG